MISCKKLFVINIVKVSEHIGIVYTCVNFTGCRVEQFHNRAFCLIPGTYIGTLSSYIYCICHTSDKTELFFVP